MGNRIGPVENVRSDAAKTEYVGILTEIKLVGTG
jgi:hypothetical protein